MTSPEVQAIINLAAQLGVSSNRASTNLSAVSLLVAEDEEDCDFSSFPSLSLEESPGNYHTGIFSTRGDVESHVESLLSRPILLGKQDDGVKSGILDDPESDSLDEFFVESLAEVPKQMLSNFGNSFSTLMNSRLRAYAAFLTRHGLSLARCSKTNQELEGVVGIEHKLETMLEIGGQVSVGPKAFKLTVIQDKLPTELHMGEEDEAYQLSLPVEMQITINVALPHVKEADGSEHMEVSFQTTGAICGIFAKPTKASPSLLRVAEVSLNMHELLHAMAEQASKVISCIVEMTNAAYTVPLPSVTEGRVETTFALRAEHKKRKVAFADEDAIVSLSPEKCANIVDCVFGGELDDTLLIPPTAKKLKVSHLEPPHTILN